MWILYPSYIELKDKNKRAPSCMMGYEEAKTKEGWVYCCVGVGRGRGWVTQGCQSSQNHLHFLFLQHVDAGLFSGVDGHHLLSICWDVCQCTSWHVTQLKPHNFRFVLTEVTKPVSNTHTHRFRLCTVVVCWYKVAWSLLLRHLSTLCSATGQSMSISISTLCSGFISKYFIFPPCEMIQKCDKIYARYKEIDWGYWQYAFLPMDYYIKLFFGHILCRSLS